MTQTAGKDSPIKSTVKNLTCDLTEKYVKEFVRESVKRTLAGKNVAEAVDLEKAWKKLSESAKDDYLKDLEKKIASKIESISTDENELLKALDLTFEEDFTAPRISEYGRKQEGIKNEHGKAEIRKPDPSIIEKILSSAPAKALIALTLIAVVAYIVPPILNPPQLSVNPETLDFGTLSELPQSMSFKITNAGGGSLTWDARSDSSWISVSPDSGKGDADVTVSLTGSPGSGTHQGSVRVNSNGGMKDVNVRIHVERSPVLAVDPSSLLFQMNAREMPQRQIIRISNAGEGNLSWNASADSPWISLNRTEGTNDTGIAVGITNIDDREIALPSVLERRDIVRLEEATIRDRILLSGNVSVSSKDGGVVAVPVSLEITRPARLAISPDPLSLSFERLWNAPEERFVKGEAQKFKIRNDGGEELDFEITSDPWIRIDPQAGTLGSGEQREVSVDVDVQNLEMGNHSGTIIVNSSAGRKEANVNVHIEKIPQVEPQPLLKITWPARLAISPDPLTLFFEEVSGDRNVKAATQTFRIINKGEQDLNYNISSDSWIVASPQYGTVRGGEESSIYIDVDAQNLGFGNHSGQLHITSNGGEATGNVELKRRLAID